MNPLFALFLALVLAGVDKPKQERPSIEILPDDQEFVPAEMGEAEQEDLVEDEDFCIDDGEIQREEAGDVEEEEEEGEEDEDYLNSEGEGEAWDDDYREEEGGVIWEEIEIDPDWWNADLQEGRDEGPQVSAQDDIWEDHQGSEREVIREGEEEGEEGEANGVQANEPDSDVIKAQVA